MNRDYWEDDFSRAEVEKRLADSLDRYHKERRQFYFFGVPFLVTLIGSVVALMSWLFVKFGPSDIDLDRLYLVAPIFAVCILIPPILMLRPERPNLNSAAYDMMLNCIGQTLANTKS